MATKKRKAAPRVREAVPTYTARSSPTRPKKTKLNGAGDALWTLFNSLSEGDQGAFVRHLLDNPEWYEDICDGISIVQADKELGRPLEEYMAEYMARTKTKRTK